MIIITIPIILKFIHPIQDILQDDSNEQVATHIEECRSDLNRYTPCRGRTWPTHHMCPHGSHVWQLSTKSLLSWNQASAPGMKSWLPAIVRPDRHPGLPHSPSNKPPQSREVRFDKIVTRLLGLPSPIKPDLRLVQLKACPPGLKRCGP
jgi:hypothetical protein